MKKRFSHHSKNWFIVGLSILFSIRVFAQVETLSTGSFIINMGATNPNTIGNGLKPYGLIYDLMKNNKVPVKWVISQTKVKDGPDFTYSGVAYKGGTFIIPAEFRTAAVNAKITSWQGQGVTGFTTISPLTVDVTRTLVSVPKWTLDAANGAIAQAYLTNAGITLTAFPGAYNWKSPQTLDCCDDFFVMPHADPTWATHSRLFSWNRDCLGSVWAACHAVSALENSINPSNSSEQMNFLSTRTAVTTPAPWPNNSLKLWGTHGGGSIPYTHQLPNDPVAQYLGTTDAAQLNGSEQIYIPKQAADAGGATRWRPGVNIIAYDPTQLNVTAPNLAIGNVAAVMVYGRAFDNANRGYVMYEAGHSHNKGTTSDVAAQRAFLNFSFFQVQPKAPQLTFSGISGGQTIQGNTTITGLNVGATSPLSGITFSYQWTSSCGGTFSNATGTTTNFTAPNVGSTTNCVISCVVTDNCGRTSFQSFPVTILAVNPPVANPDAQTIDPGCGSVTISKNVLANDTDADGGTLTLTQINGNAGSFTTVNGGLVSFTSSGNVTYTSATGFVGVETLTYQVCDNTSPAPLCTNGTYTITVGNAANLPNATNDAFTIAEDAIGTFNVLANDIPVVSGPLIVSGITSGPANGKISVNTDNTITYIPNADFAGTDNFTYRVVNALGYTRTATVTVTVSDDACNAGTYQTTAPGSGSVTYSASLADAAIIYSSPLKNWGITTTLEVNSNNGAQQRRALLNFNLSSIPVGATITSSQLRLVRTGGNNTAQNIGTYRVTTSWNEGTLDNAANTLASNGATWYGPTYSTNWSAPGGDFVTTSGAVTSVSNNTGGIGGTATYGWDVTTITQGWYNNTFANEGLIVKDVLENNGNDKVFASRDNGTAGNRPVLRVTYNPGNITVDIQASKDNWIQENTLAKVYGNATTFEVDANGPNANEARLLVKFDVKPADIPTGSTVTSAIMKLTRTGGDNTAQNIGAYQATNSWNEAADNNQNNTAILNGATWFHRNYTQMWNTNGGDFTTTGGAVISVSNATGGTGGTANYDWNVLSIVQNWVKTSPDPNYGFLIKAVAENVNLQQVFGTRENGTAGNRPTLIVNYTTPAGCSAIPARLPLGNLDTAATISTTAVTFNVLNNDYLFSQPATALSISTVPIAAQGTATANLATGEVTFTPNPTFNGVATFQYTVTTANGTDVVRVFVRVNNSPVNANDDNPAGLNSGVAQTISVLSNDLDPEAAPLTVTIVTQPANGTATVNGSNQVVYTPNTGFTGTDVLTYQVCEPAPACGSANCDVATVNIVVLNQAPVATPDSKTILPCLPNTINLLGNDTDPEGHTLTVINLSALSIPAAGTLVNNNDGTVTFAPATGFLGVVTFTYSVSDNGVPPQTSSAPATVTITVNNPPNTAPVAVNDVETTNMDQVLFSAVKDNDSDPENQTLSVPVITISPLHGTATVNSINGIIEYTPNPGFSGTDVLTYRVCDEVITAATCTFSPGLCTTATLSITVLAPNIVVGINDQNSTWINTPVNGATLWNDLDPQGDLPLSFGGFLIGGSAYTSGTQTVSGVDATGTPVANAGSLTINADGSYTFTPANNFAGVVSVPYVVADANPNTATDTAHLRITVNPFTGVFNSVIANNDENSTLPNTTVSSTVFSNDADPQGNAFTLTSYQYDSNGDGTPDGTGTIGSAITIGGITTAGTPVSNAGTLTINANGTYTFMPAADFTGLVEVPYTITDAIGAIATAILKIDVLPDINGPSNNEPFAGDDFKYTNVNTAVSGSSISNSDSDPNGNVITVTQIGSTPVSGATTVATPNGSITIQPNGSYTYTPNAGYIGPDEITYQVCDNGAPSLCSKAALYFLVGVNNTTDAVNDENSTWQDVNVIGGVIANDFDKEKNTQTFGSFLLQNLGGDIASGATVSGTDKTGAPVANAGILSFAADGSYTFDPDPAFTGTVSIPYRLCDNGNLSSCDTAYLTITVDPLPTTGSNTVIANNDENISYGSSVSNNVLHNDRDPQNNSFTVTGVTGSSPGTSFTVPGIDVNGNAVSDAGSLVINVGGSYTYLPATGFAGSINVPYTITDALGASAQAILHIDVVRDPNGSQNDPPFAGDDFGYTTINNPVTGNFINTDSDPNIDPVSYNGVTIVPAGPATPIGAPVATSQGGTIQFFANGTYTYTPPMGYTGPDKVNYQICDVTPVAPQPLCADAVIHLLVGPGINIAGKVWDDSNGDVDDDGAAEPETNISGSLFVNLVNAAGNVVAVVPVANDGTYSFNDVTPGTNYSLVLSTSAGTIGQLAPAASLPSGWTNTGETRNGTIDLGAIGMIDTRAYGFTNTINFDFGIEQLPESDLKNTTIQTPTVGQFFTLNGGSNPPVLSGSDAEDCAGACLLTSRSVIIDALPANSSLYYNGVLVTAGQLINNFDPSLLQIEITAATIGSFGTSFQYSFVDAAGKKDPTPATYSLNWLIRLPVEGLRLAAFLNGSDVVLNWKTISESNSAYFEIERSVDNRNFFKVGNNVQAAGSSNFERNYQTKDDIKDISLTDKIYYRAKLVDMDGKITYSNVAIVRIPKVTGIKAWPNPFKSAVTISFNLDQNATLALRVTDMAGRTIMQRSYKAARGVSYLTLHNLDDLTNGVYMLEVIDTNSGQRNVIKLEKNH